jgi:flagellar assembly protein FliH
LPEYQLASLPYTYAEVRGPRADRAVSVPTTFEVSATASVPAALLDAARAEATAAGFASGWAQGVREATASMDRDVQESARQAQALTAERRAAVHSALTALDRSADALVSNATETVEQIEDTVLSLAIELAEALLQRELRLSETVARDALARALHFAPAEAPITVRLSPRDHATLNENRDPAVAGARQITLVADPSLPNGDAIAICGVTRVDARLSEGLTRVKAVLAS